MSVIIMFNIMSLLLHTLNPMICRLFNAVGKKCFWLITKSVMHRFYHINIIICKLTTSCSLHEGFKWMEIRRGQVCSVGRILKNFLIQFLNGVDGEVCCKRACIAV